MKFFLISGGLLLALAAFFFVREQSFLGRAQQVTGTVTDMQTSLDTDNNPMYCPIIEFQTASGERGRYAAPCTVPAAYSVGDQVQLIYDPQNINNAKLPSASDAHLASFITASIGVPLFLIGIYGWWLDRNRQRKSRYVT